MVALPNDKAAPAQPQMETIHFLAAHHDLSSIACATRTRMGTNVWFHLLDQGTTVLRHGLLSRLSIHVSMVVKFKDKAPTNLVTSIVLAFITELSFLSHYYSFTLFRNKGGHRLLNI